MKYSELFKSKKELVQSKYVCAGFDGFVDFLIHAVKTRADEKTVLFIPQLQILVTR